MPRFLLNLFSGLIFFIPFVLLGQTPTIDVLHYKIEVEVPSMTQQILVGNTTITALVKQDSILEFNFELYKLRVDSTYFNGQKVNFIRTKDSLITFYKPDDTVFKRGDTLRFQVWYRGVPATDPKGFSGVFIDRRLNMAYNKGVTNDFYPPNFGKAWFACVDNFEDKATFEVFATAPAGLTAVCGGSLKAVKPLSGGRNQFHWSLRDPVSTYLASFAIGRFSPISRTYQTILGNTIPVGIYVIPGRENAAEVLFANLNKTIRLYEELFGPYFWERVGYVTTGSGAALEHACNISIPEAILMFGSTFDWLIAHEMAHSWFGNNVTCHTGQDMWFNEGFARYLETVFYERIYSPKHGKDWLRRIQAYMLERGMYESKVPLPIAPIPKNLVYGAHVYEKGAMVVHNLRHYLGDSVFFRVLKKLMTEKKYGTITTEQFRHFLQANTGVDLSDFFRAHVYAPGYTNYLVDSFSVRLVNGQYETTVYIRQHSFGKPHLPESNRLEIAFYGADDRLEVKSLTYQGVNGSIKTTLPFRPNTVMLDPEQKLANATIQHTTTFNRPATYDFVNTHAYLTVTDLDAPTVVRICSIYDTPSHFPVAGYKNVVPAARYWHIETNKPESLRGNAFLLYGADTTLYANYRGDTNFFDKRWLTNLEDSLVLFYRKTPTEPWKEYPEYEIRKGLYDFDSQGHIYVRNIRAGYYAPAVINSRAVHRVDSQSNRPNLCVYPNPANEKLTVSTEFPVKGTFIVTDMQGKVVYKGQLSHAQSTFQINTEAWPVGMYNLQLNINQQSVSHLIQIYR